MSRGLIRKVSETVSVGLSMFQNVFQSNVFGSISAEATKVIGNHVFFKLSSYSIYRNEKGAILVLDINGSANYYMDDLLALSTRWEANSIGLPSQTVSIYENDYERIVFIELPNKNLRAVETYSFDSLGRKCKTPIRGQIIDLQIVNSFK